MERMMYSPSEKAEIIELVAGSDLGVRRTLREIGLSPSTFYPWYKKFWKEGMGGLTPKHKTPKQFWNKIPETEKDRVVEVALQYPEKSCREVAFHLTDRLGYFISESSVYRILKARNLVSSPAFTLISAKEKFQDPTTRINELWQTDFTYFHIVHWGWYYLSTVMDDFSRKILAWKLCKGMGADEVKETIDMALKNTGVSHVKIFQKPRLLSDNGPCYISSSLKAYLKDKSMDHTRSAPYHPQTQGKIERYHRSMKNLILLDKYYSPEELTEQIERWVEYYNYHRYHEAINNLIPADKYDGKEKEILMRRADTKLETMQKRRRLNQPNQLIPV